MRVSRAMSLALGWLLAATASCAQGEGIPSIFSDVAPSRRPAVPKLEAPEIVRGRLPLSPQARSAMNERVTVAGAAAPVAATAAEPGKLTWKDYLPGDAIMMDKFFVNVRREKKVEVETLPSYVVKAFTTGEILPERGSRPSLNWGLNQVRSTGYGTGASAPRFELFFRLSR